MLVGVLSQVQVFFKNPERWAQVLGAAIPQTSNVRGGSAT